MSINVVVSSTAAGVSVSGGTSVAITVGGGIGPAGFLVAPGTATNAFGTFQLTAGDGITISTSAAQFQIASYGTTAVSSLAPVQSVAGRVGAVQLQASDVTAGTFAIARIPTISYTALANVPATFNPSSHSHSTSDVVSFTSAAAAAAPVQSVAGRSGAVTLAKADVGLGSVDNTADSSKPVSTAQAAADAAVQAHAVQRANHSGTQPASTISDFAAEAAKYGPVVSVAGRTGAVSLAAADVSGLASVATSGSYTSLQNVPATFSPQAHTHSTADVVGLTASFSQVGHTHDYAATIHTHSTADIAGYQSFPAQAGKSGPLVTDGTAASWATRYSVVDPVLVQGAGMTLTRDTSAGSITVAFAGGTSGVVVSSATPQPLGTASAGVSGDAARADHVHLMPSAADVGAAATNHAHPYVQVLNGLTGTVSIAGGAGVTVSTASSSITISAGGGGGSANIVEAATAAGFPGTGASGTLYLATDASRAYRWSGSVYVEIGPSGGGSSSIIIEATEAAFPATGAAGTLYVATEAKTISFWSGSAYETLGAAAPLLNAPTGLTATAGNALVSLAWTAPSGTITDYRVQYSSDSGTTWTTFADGTSTATSATVTSLTNGTAYAFRVAAVNGTAVGTYTSASSSVTPTAAVFRAIPTMTDYTSPSGEVSGEGNQNPVNSLLWQAFDGNTSTYAQFLRAGSNTPKRMIQYAFPAGQKSLISGYAITPFMNFGNPFSQWQVYGSDDLSTWTEIDSRSGISGWTNQTARQFNLSQQRNFRAYRWVFQSTTDDGDPNQISTLQLTE